VVFSQPVVLLMVAAKYDVDELMLTGRELPVPSNVPPDAALYQRMSWLGSGLGVAETAPTAVPQPVSPTGAVGGLGLFNVNTTTLEIAWLAQILLTARTTVYSKESVCSN
jgi:hypothetical protein